MHSIAGQLAAMAIEEQVRKGGTVEIMGTDIKLTQADLTETKMTKWTQELPKVDGWYWMYKPGGDPEVVEVQNFRLFRVDAAEWSAVFAFNKRWWYGPVEPPKFEPGDEDA